MNQFMQGTAQHQAAPSRFALSFPLKKLFGGALLGAALAAAPAAHAGVITFEDYVNNLVGDSDYFDEAGVRLSGFSNAPNGQPGDFVGAIFDGSDRGACGNLACPVNNESAYYAALNDGILQLDQLDGNYVSVRGFDASFIGAAQGVSYPAVSGLLRVQGFYANGSSVYETYQLGGPIGGSFQFQHFDTSASFGNQQFSSVAFFGFTCNTTGNCNAFSSNQGQFALDNIVVSVPEPSTYAMMLFGLAGIVAVARRRNRRQAQATFQAQA